MTKNLSDLYFSGDINYNQYQQQSAINTFQFGVQQAQRIADASNAALAKSQVDAAQASVISQLNRLNTLESFADVVASTRKTLDYQNQTADRAISILNQNMSNAEQATFQNQKVFEKIYSQRKGAVMAQGVGGAVSGQGSSGDLVDQTKSETLKDSNAQYRNDINSIKQIQEQVFATQLAKAFNNFNTETQIKFSLNSLKGQL